MVLFESSCRCTQIKTYSWDNAQVVLVGNKCDLEDERVVSFDRGKQLAEQLGKLICVIDGILCLLSSDCYHFNPSPWETLHLHLLDLTVRNGG